jgi:hypothetical protein
MGQTGLTVKFGMPGIWFTINPGDLSNPLVLKLAGVEMPAKLSQEAIRNLKIQAATQNPVAVATFFSAMIESFFSCLVRPDSSNGGLFGQVETYFATTETNGRGMLHLHGLLFFKGNLSFIKVPESLIIFKDRQHPWR